MIEAVATDEGAQERLAALYARHMPEAVRLAYLLTGDRSATEDVAQEAFIRAGGRLAHLRDPDAFGPYFRRAVVNAAKMHLRHQSVRARHETGEGPPTLLPVEERVLTARTLRTALMELPLRQRTAIVLRYWLDLPDEEACDVLRCRPGTLRSLISRGLATLRVEMEGDRDG